MKGKESPQNMRKALAQNPNLLRTLIGMGLTLIFLLAYAVYGQQLKPKFTSMNPIQSSHKFRLSRKTRFYDADDNRTIWTWDANLNGINLTWVNLSGEMLSIGSTISISNAAGLYSHPDLGNPDAEDFSCSESCKNDEDHTINITSETTEIISLTDPDPALRGKGSLFADSLDEAKEKSDKVLSTNFTPTSVRITVIEQGERDVAPTVTLTQVNEELGDVEQFEIDAATEFMWALAAVIGCFGMILVPSFTVYWAAQAKQKKLELKLQNAQTSLEEE